MCYDSNWEAWRFLLGLHPRETLHRKTAPGVAEAENLSKVDLNGCIL